jgi:hypothetical protein
MAASLLAIEARWQRIDGHPQAFWLLCDDRQQVLAELHCLARDAGGPWAPPSRPVPARSVRMVHLVHPGAGFDATIPGMPAPSRRPYDASEILLRVEDTAEATRARWQHAACALPLLNRSLEEADEHGAPLDSHSVLVALGRWMGLEAPPPWPGRPETAANALPPIRGPGGAVAIDRVAADANAGAPPPPVAAPDDPMLAHPLYRQSRQAVLRLEGSLGRDYDATSERLTRSLVELAQTHGLSGIDHVVLSRRSGKVAAGENVFVIRGCLHDPAHQRVSMRTEDALDLPDDEGNDAPASRTSGR